MIERPEIKFPPEASHNPLPMPDYHPSLERADNLARIFGSAKLPSEFRQQVGSPRGVKYTRTSAAIETGELKIAIQAGSSVSLIVSRSGLHQIEYCLSASDGSITGMRKFDRGGNRLDWSSSSEIDLTQVRLADSYLAHLIPKETVQGHQTMIGKLLSFFSDSAKRVAQIFS